MTDIEKLEAEIARLRERISDQEDGLRYGEKVCATLVSERDAARSQVKAWQAEELARRAERDEVRAEVERLRGDLARCREVQAATAEGWRHEVAEVAAIVGAPAHTAELAAYVRAEIERLRQRISDQDDALRYGEGLCARLVAERDEARRERDEARARVAAEAGKDLAAWAADLDAAEAAHARVVAERDEARAEVERLRREREALVETEQRLFARVYAELEDARAEVERLRDEVA